MAKKKTLTRKRKRDVLSSQADPSDPDKQPSKSFPIVGIGASAGGLAAIEAFLSAIPKDVDQKIAFIIVQHLSPGHKSILSELLKRYTQMQVWEATDGSEIEPYCAYTIPPNRDLGVLNGRIQLFEHDPSQTVRHPIDFFFRSLAADQREKSICIVLSGTGTDGTLGVRAVKGEGGMAMAQTPESTEFDGMPRSAIATGLVDFVLPPAEMPAQLNAYLEQIAGQKISRTTSAAQQERDATAKICVLLRVKTTHDFSQYKETTIVRRLRRRMALHQIDEVPAYLRYLQQNGAELAALFKDMLIGVTSFFRDADAFDALERLAIPQLIKQSPLGGTIRVWVCGCSTGEEAYSIAIQLKERLEKEQQLRNIQIFATDIDRHATDQARAGLYPPSIAADVSPQRLARFFTQETNGSYRIQKSIRDCVIFSEQDVIKDPPFSKLNLISCRNLLIYLNTDLQKRLIPLFHYALNTGGLLFLGNAESIGDQQLLFDALDRKAKLYRRKGSSDPHALAGGVLSLEPWVSPLVNPQVRRPRKLNLREVTEQSLLKQRDAAAVLVNGRGEILYVHGRTGNFLEPAPGAAASNVVSMSREGLRRDLAAALHRAVAKRETVSFKDLRVLSNRHSVLLDLTVVPAPVPKDDARDLFLVIFEEKFEPAVPPPIPLSAAGIAATDQVAALEQKLRSKDEYIQTTLEEMETSSEELKSLNEEMQSVNEEMQSANEELETSREELQSLNEELATVNAELQQKVQDLSRANNDMSNLLAGTGVGTLFVDHKLRVTRFTPSIKQIINFIETDVGRPLGHIVSNVVGYDRLLADVQSVLETLTPVEVEVQTKEHNWYILTIRPYRTLENVIEGAVITFVDITKRKAAEQALIEADRFRSAAQIETVGIAFFTIDGPITSANDAFLNMISYDREFLESGRLRWDLIIANEDMPLLLRALDDLKAKGKTVPYEGKYVRRDSTRGPALFAAWRLDKTEAVIYTISVTSRN